jgi:hypothetical protein
MQAGTALAHFFAGRFDSAANWAERALDNLPSLVVAVAVAAASYALADREAEAQRAMRRLRELMPSLRVSGLRDWLPIQRPEDLAQFGDGLRRAGLPE